MAPDDDASGFTPACVSAMDPSRAVSPPRVLTAQSPVAPPRARRPSTKPTTQPRTAAAAVTPATTRSEERRVGKECRSRRLPDQQKKKMRHSPVIRPGTTLTSPANPLTILTAQDVA